MLKNDNMSAKPNTMKCASAIKIVLGKRRGKSLPNFDQDNDLQNLPKNGKGTNPIDIKSGMPLKKVYNVEKVEVKKANQEKSKIVDKKHYKKSNNANSREQLKEERKKSQKRSQDKLNNAQKKIQQEKCINPQKWSQEKQSKAFNDRKCSYEKPKSSTDHKKNLEHRLSTKIWQIMSRDLFLLDYEKFNNKIQATDSETKKYIISVIKKCNNKELKKQNPPRHTQTSRETMNSNNGNRKKAIKRRVRRQLWQWAKGSIKHSEHWSKFLAENNIVLDNINIDKFDLSLIDVNALGIENKLLKRTIMWLFK